ncbi:putative short-chain type dehydrogenase/reductase y4vI [Colletotrichum tanaceti]|uniref:Putative short-chain type dehydrogenase/reductase y4vI n=1 Tax=Colletotrichum tanaceti TaxID=1306861 RepID=A0A4U6XB29_9PEZI|nr:putative short-chain type dehydrogenase/reductase y4vI [Colletotrichum tanaceti]
MRVARFMWRKNQSFFIFRSTVYFQIQHENRNNPRVAMALDALPVLVVIGGGGIGLATAHRLGAGRHILLASRSPSTLAAGAESLRNAGHKVTTQQVDVSCYESVAAVAQAAACLGGAVETVVLTSAVSPSMGTTGAILAVDVLGTANVIEAFGGREVEMAPGSSLTCVASMVQHNAPPLSAALERHLAVAPLSTLLENAELRDLVGGDGGPSGVAYCVAKRANRLRAQAAAVSREYAGRGVRVNCVSPGMTRTNMLAVEAEGASGEAIRKIMKEHPLKRAGTAEEVADAVAFVAGCGYVNGTDLLVDGGWIAKKRWGEMGAD